MIGVYSVSEYPKYGHQTYISENALMPGSAFIDYSDKQYQQAIQISKLANPKTPFNSSVAQ